ncbi:MAG TPA: hypothetical protein HPP51_03050 [Planctomycetes bacterium]|nr:hypothetical protein [Planctomycetota bacterium]
MSMSGGYPADADIISFLSDMGVEDVTENNSDYMVESRRRLWGVFNAIRWAMTLGVYCPSTTTFNVREGKYLFKGQVKTYSAGGAVDPTDNDTTYVWMKDDNTIDSGIDGDGWPSDEHIKLAEIDVDSDGVITDVRDLRGRAFLQYPGFYLTDAGSSVEAMPVHWDSASPADDDEVRIPVYAENDNDEKIEYARIVVKLTDVSDGSEDAEVKLSRIIAGSLTSLGDIVGSTGTQTLTNKTIDVDSNTVSNINGAELANSGSDGGVTFVLTATLTAGSTVQIHNSNAPFKYRVLDAWSVATSADGGTWKLTDGSNDITDAVTVTGTDKTIDRAGTIDDAYHEIAASGSLSVVGDGANADAIVYVLAMRVS